MNRGETWQRQLRHVITPYVGSDGLEEGTSGMVDAAAGHHDVHERFVSTIQRGLHELDIDEAEVRRMLDSAGFPFQRRQQTLEFLQRLQALYLAKYRERADSVKKT